LWWNPMLSNSNKSNDKVFLPTELEDSNSIY